MKTKVKFLIEPQSEGGEKNVYAFFPEEDYNDFSNQEKMCYAHIGQHSGCHIDYAEESREATKEEYTPLQEELESIGYKLQILNK